MEQRSLKLSLAMASVLLRALPAQAQVDAPAAGRLPRIRAAWTAAASARSKKAIDPKRELGAGYVDESSAKFGDYTGLDEDGAVVVAGAEGGVAMESGYRLDYNLTDLGLDSRAVSIEGGKQGSYEFGAFYDRVPHRISDTGETIFERCRQR